MERSGRLGAEKESDSETTAEVPVRAVSRISRAQHQTTTAFISHKETVAPPF